ncbi:MAG: hypothetical protein H6559_26250 [Lewinellaceae bacterium]|nr:hypothetical protein [Lewinellaceae bacterium]
MASGSKTVKVLSDTTKIEITPSDTLLCALGEACFEVTDTTLWDCIQWVDAGGAIVGTGGELCVTPPGFGLYWYVAQVDSTLRCVLPDTAYVKVVPDSLSATVEGPDKVCEGDSICLAAAVGPDPTMAMVTWTDETGAVLGTGLELCVTPGPGMHTYTATADNGCAVASGSKTVKVLSDTTKIEIAPSDTLLCALGEACFEVTDTTLWDCIQWVDAGGAIVGTGGELCVTPPGFGLYWYVAQVDSTLRCVLPDTAYVKVVPDSLSATVDGPDKVCEGDSICLAAAVGPDPTMAMVTWTDETGATIGTGLELCVTPGPGMHTYTATADNGCAVASGSKTVKVLSDTTKIEIAPSDTLLCALGEACFEVTDTTLWDCIQWVDAGGAIVGTGGELCVTPPGFGLYWYVAQVDSTLRCVLPDTAYVKVVPDSLSVTVNGPDKVCEGDSICLAAAVGPDPTMAMVTWTDETGATIGTGLELCVTPGPGMHTYTATADNGCAVASGSKTVKVLSDTTKIEITPADTVTLCAIEEVCFEVTDTTLWDCIQWVDAGGAIVGTGGELCVTPPGFGLYWYVAQVDSTLRCVLPDTAYVKVVPDSLSVTVDGPDKVCEGDSICLAAAVGPDPTMAMVTWTDETGAVLGTGLELCVTPGPGMHTYTATADNGCAIAAGSKTVKVLSDTTKIEIAPSDTLLCALGEACFEVTDTTLWDCIQWVDAGGAIVGTGGELCVTPPGFGLYWYVAQVDSTLRCVLPDTAYVKVVPDSLSVTVDGPDKVCEGDSICLAAAVGPDPIMAMVTWTDETGAVLGTGLELCVTPGPGMHTYTATADNGCAIAAGSKTVKVLSDTTKIEIAPSDTLLCALGEACFEVTDTTLWDCIQWVDAGGMIVGTGGSLCVMPAEPGLYQYIAQGRQHASVRPSGHGLCEAGAGQPVGHSRRPGQGMRRGQHLPGGCRRAGPHHGDGDLDGRDGHSAGHTYWSCASRRVRACMHTYTATADNGCAVASGSKTVKVLSDTTKIEITPSDTVTLCALEEVCFEVTDTTLWDCIQWVDAGARSSARAAACA